MEEAYSFFYNYFKIFETSLNSNVSKWSCIDINNSIKWSINCEYFYQKLKNKPGFGNFLQDLQNILDQRKLISKKKENNIFENLLKNASTQIKIVNLLSN